MADPNHSQPRPLCREDVQHLAWGMLDGCATPREMQQLAEYLERGPEARKIYLECVQLHVDLLAQFGGLPKCELTELLMAIPQVDVQPVGTPVKKELSKELSPSPPPLPAMPLPPGAFTT